MMPVEKKRGRPRVRPERIRLSRQYQQVVALYLKSKRTNLEKARERLTRMSKIAMIGGIGEQVTYYTNAVSATNWLLDQLQHSFVPTKV